MKDNRISSILMKTGMTERSLERMEDVKRVTLDKPNEEKIEKVLDAERNASKVYLQKALDFERVN